MTTIFHQVVLDSDGLSTTELNTSVSVYGMQLTSLNWDEVIKWVDQDDDTDITGSAFRLGTGGLLILDHNDKFVGTIELGDYVMKDDVENRLFVERADGLYQRWVSVTIERE